MNNPLLRLLLAALLASIPISSAAYAEASIPSATTTPLAIDAFSSIPAVGHPAISPDGKHIALIQEYKGRPAATIWDQTDPKSPPIIVPFSSGFVIGVMWANDRRLLITLNYNASNEKKEFTTYYRTVSYDIETKQGVILFSNNTDLLILNGSASNIIDLKPDDPDHVYISLFSDIAQTVRRTQSPIVSIFRVDVNTGVAKEYLVGTSDTSGFIMDGSGNVVIRTKSFFIPREQSIEVLTSDKNWVEIARTTSDKGNGFGIAGLSIDAKSLIIHGSINDYQTEGLLKLSLTDGSITTFASDPAYDIEHAILDPYTFRVIGYRITTHLTKDHYFDPKLQALQSKLENDNLGISVHAVSWSRALDKLVLRMEGANEPPAFFLYDVANDKYQRLGRSYPRLSQNDLGQVRVYDYKARDGLEIPAYLTLPPNKGAKNLPVVILPHGGPMARDDMSFDWESQFLANRGYAVLRPNFRGSSGYGKKFTESGFGQWGLKMQDDVTDGVNKLIADGIADPKRICIVGGSYGGYAALAGAAFTPDLYACAAAWAPVSDILHFLDKHAEDYGPYSRLVSAWEHYIGDRWFDTQKLNAASPARHAANIKIPILLMHGQADNTVPIDQSERMEQALQAKGRKVTFIRIDKDTHYMQDAETRLRWLTELEKFLKENIGN